MYLDIQHSEEERAMLTNRIHGDTKEIHATTDAKEKKKLEEERDALQDRMKELDTTIKDNKAQLQSEGIKLGTSRGKLSAGGRDISRTSLEDAGGDWKTKLGDKWTTAKDDWAARTSGEEFEGVSGFFKKMGVGLMSGPMPS